MDCGFWIADLLYRFALSFFIKLIRDGGLSIPIRISNDSYRTNPASTRFGTRQQFHRLKYWHPLDIDKFEVLVIVF